jgi:hypothetical protein
MPDLETIAVDGLDPCSSGPWADVWARPPPMPNKPPPVSQPESWLLRRGWRRHGPILREEGPAD